MVNIATAWQSAESAQLCFDEGTHDTVCDYTWPEQDEDNAEEEEEMVDFDCKKLSDHKREKQYLIGSFLHNVRRFYTECITPTTQDRQGTKEIP